MENHDLEFIYKKLKDKYDLVLTNAFALDAGFDTDIQLLTGESVLGKFYLYIEYFMGGDYHFVFSVDLLNETYTHWHPQTKEQALEDVIAFMEGTLKF